MGDFLSENERVLFHASEKGRTDIIQHVIGTIRSNDGSFLGYDEVSKAISVKRTDEDISPLHVASIFGHADVVRSLLNAGADLNSRPSKGIFAGYTPYQLAQGAAVSAFHIYLFEQIAMDNVSTIKQLLMAGISASIGDETESNDTPLHWASSFNKLNSAIALIEGGASVNSVNAYKQTPLHIICKLNNLPRDELITLLMQEGGDISLTDKDGHTCKYYVKENNKDVLLVLNSNILPSMEHTHAFVQNSKEESTGKSKGELSELIKEYVSNRNTVTPTRSSDLSPQPGNSDSRNPSAMHVRDDTGNSYMSDMSENGEDINDGRMDGNTTHLPHLVLWPPAQRQKRFHGPSVVLNNDEVLYISFQDVGMNNSIDVNTLLLSSGLSELFAKLKFTVCLKKVPKGAKIHLSINQTSCPGRHKYKLTVRHGVVNIVASDVNGLLYSLFILGQLVQLHSDHLVKSAGSKGSNVGSPIGSLEVHLPLVEVIDWPDIPNRAVIWSFRSTIFSSTFILTDLIELLSKSRINQLYLLLDAPSSHSSSNRVDDATNQVFLLENIAKQYGIELVPLVQIRSVEDHLPVEMIQSFTSRSLAVVITYTDKVTVTPNAKSVSANDIHDVYKVHCRSILSKCNEFRIDSLMISSSKYVLKHICPMDIIRSEGLSLFDVIEVDIDFMFPSALYIKPFFGSMQSYASATSYHVMRAVDNGCSTLFLSVLQEREFMYPVILLKFIAMLYGGLAWNRVSVVDMLGSDLADLPLLQKVACWLIFNSQWHLCTDEIRTFLDCVTTSGSSMVSTDNTMSTAAGTQLNSNSNLSQMVTSSNYISPPADLAYTESILIGLLMSDVTICSFAPPSKQDTAYYLKLVRRIQVSAKWKMNANTPKSFFDFVTGNNSSKSAEITNPQNAFVLPKAEKAMLEAASLNEYYNLLSMTSILGRAIIMAYNTLEKTQKSLPTTHSIKDLMDVLPPGMKSDIANACLETLENATSVWKKRIQCNAFSKIDFLQSNALSNAPLGKKHPMDIIAYTRTRYLYDNSLPSLPLLGVFYAISENLPIVKTVQSALTRMTQEFNPNQENSDQK